MPGPFVQWDSTAKLKLTRFASKLSDTFFYILIERLTKPKLTRHVQEQVPSLPYESSYFLPYLQATSIARQMARQAKSEIHNAKVREALAGTTMYVPAYAPALNMHMLLPYISGCRV